MALTYDTTKCHNLVREELAGITESIIFATMYTRHGVEINDKTLRVFVTRFNIINHQFGFIGMASTKNMREVFPEVWVDKFGLTWIGKEYPSLYLSEDSVKHYWFGLKTNVNKDTDAAWNKNLISNIRQNVWDKMPTYVRYDSVETMKEKFNELCIQAD
jgi:hypothetical protein